MPSFTWILRDCTLDKEDPQGNPISSVQYLEQCLGAIEDAQKGDQMKNKNRMCKTLRTCFPRRTCFTFCRPLDSEKKMKQLNTIEYEELEQEFKDTADEFVKEVKTKLKVMTLNGVEFDGQTYVSYISNLLEKINEGKVLNIENNFTAMCRV